MVVDPAASGMIVVEWQHAHYVAPIVIGEESGY